MATLSSPRKGSLQYWPRKRAAKFLPSVNWRAIQNSSSISSISQPSIIGFIAYKAGMMSALVKDATPNSLTKDKKIIIPVTILECPPMKIFSVRFYRNGKPVKEVLAPSLDKELKRRVKLPKNSSEIKFEEIKNFDDVCVIAYSQAKKTGIKKTPDMLEVALVGNINDKMQWVKEHINKEILASSIFKENMLIDIRGVTKGHGLQGPVKRFGIGLKSHKSEKGRRRPGSLGPWHPARVTFRAPMAGQHGLHTRLITNLNVIALKKPDQEKNSLRNLMHYGDVKNEYLIVRGSVIGPHKRQVVLTCALRPTKKQKKRNFEFLEFR
jgi:large subunit ribosomal protein L3